jgi:hypothetical protein
MRTFGSFTFDIVEELFNIKEVDTLPLLTEWLEATYVANEHQIYNLNRYKDKLLKKALIWNEDELKSFFIGPLVEMADINNNNYQAFMQRSFSFKYKEEEIGGRVDFIVAGGRRVPKLPYFFIHEYKQEPDGSGEPLGQLLIAMVAAHYLNEHKFPMLGAYVVGRNWFFVILDDNKYSRSIEFDASSEDIFQIFAILQKSKEIIERYI